MTGFVERPLPAAILTRIETDLRYGHDLAQQIALVHDIHRWTARTFCPAEASSDQLLAVDTSLNIRAAAGFAWLTQQMATFLFARERAAIVFEAALERRGDPGLCRLTVPLRYCGVHVYGIIGRDRAAPDRIAAAIRDFDNGIGFLAAMVDLAPADLGGTDDTLTEEQIAATARSAAAVVVTAYDGDSYVICEKT